MTGDNPKLDIWTSFRFSRDESKMTFFSQQSWHMQQPQNRLGYEAPNIGGDMDWLGGCCSVASHWFGIRFVPRGDLSARPGSGLLSEFSLTLNQGSSTAWIIASAQPRPDDGWGMMGGSRSLGMWVTLISIGGLAAELFPENFNSQNCSTTHQNLRSQKVQAQRSLRASEI